MDKPGRAIAVAELIRIHGPHKAAQIVKLIDEERHEDAMALSMWNRQPAATAKDTNDG